MHLRQWLVPGVLLSQTFQPIPYHLQRLQATSILNETTKTISLEDFRNLYHIKTANAHIQQWLTIQVHNISSMFSVAIELTEFWCTEIENIVRNFSLT